jgi:hypothetical protein
VNPSSGPGPHALPDSNYTQAIPELNRYDNVRLLGYVATTYTKRNISLVRQDIETYSEWPTKSSNPDLAVQGIFFDETPQKYDANSLAYLQSLTATVMKMTGLGPDHFVRDTLYRLRSILRYCTFCILMFRSVSLYLKTDDRADCPQPWGCS